MSRESSDLEKLLVDEVLKHLEGWLKKVEKDFSKESFEIELEELKSDQVYRDFGFDTPSYVTIRKIGRMSISIGRRLGEIYDKILRSITAERFKLTTEQVKEKFNNLELDISIKNEFISEDDLKHIKDVMSTFFANTSYDDYRGLGIELRYNFNPNDSARLRKDEDMVRYLQKSSRFPVYLIFSSISPREEAIRRLTNAGWKFLIGDTALRFMNELLNLDLQSIVRGQHINEKIVKNVADFMRRIYNSYAVKAAIAENTDV